MSKYSENFELLNLDNAGLATSKIKKVLKKMGIEKSIIKNVAIACYEAEVNVAIHSYGGNATIDVYEDKINVKFVDSGPGIEDIDKAMTLGFSTASDSIKGQGFGAGMGLPNIKDASDTFSLKSSEKGTILEIGFKLS